jgi:pilus assembly protein Flp/PilA
LGQLLGARPPNRVNVAWPDSRLRLASERWHSRGWLSLSSSPLHSLRRDERGQGLLEYALILMLVAIVVVGALILVGVDIDGLFESVTDGFD